MFTVTNILFATTWGMQEHECPICKNKHNYQNISSYGSYIYFWPSKYQYIYWPLTDNPSVYCCPYCHYSTYMWDFDSLDVNKIDTIKKYLSTLDMDVVYDYTAIPMTTRLAIAENVYMILGRDDEFWCKFYRLIAYHYDLDSNATDAKKARFKAMNIARKMLSDTTYEGQEKEILLIIAAMHNFTGHPDSSLVYLDKASKLTYKNEKMETDREKGLDSYLTKLISHYIEFINKEDEE